MKNNLLIFSSIIRLFLCLMGFFDIFSCRSHQQFGLNINLAQYEKSYTQKLKYEYKGHIYTFLTRIEIPNEHSFKIAFLNTYGQLICSMILEQTDVHSQCQLSHVFPIFPEDFIAEQLLLFNDNLNSHYRHSHIKIHIHHDKNFSLELREKGTLALRITSTSLQAPYFPADVENFRRGYRYHIEMIEDKK